MIFYNYGIVFICWIKGFGVFNIEGYDVVVMFKDSFKCMVC